MMRSHANGKEFSHNSLQRVLLLEGSPDCLRPRRGVIDLPAFRIWLFRVLIKGHPAQIFLKGAGILPEIVQ